jgi:hypothetical protein
MEQIDNAFDLFLNTKYDLGLFKIPINIVDDQRAKTTFLFKDLRAESRA